MTRKRFGGAEYLVAAATKDDVLTPEDLTEDQRQIGATTERFVRDEVMPRDARIEAQDFPVVVELLRECGKLGLLMLDAPEAYGGLELDKATGLLAAEKMGASASFSTAYAAHTCIGTLPLVYYGTPAQKDRYLGKIVTGEWIAAYALTEPDSGSDALGAKSTATRSADGKRWILNGTKQFITNGSFADLFTLFAKVDGKHFTAFLVERTFPGVKVGPEEKKLGIRGSSTTPILLEDAEVPVENVLGEIGKGHKIAFNVLNVGRFKLGPAVIGGAKRAFLEGVRYANLRKQFGVPIARFGAIQEKIAQMAAALFAAESLVYRLAGMMDDRLATIPKGTPDYWEAYQRGIEEYAIECAVAKVFCSEVLAQVTDEVLQIHGGYGFIQEYPAERFYRDARINRIFEGTNEINRLLVAGTILRRAAKGELALEREAGAAGAAPSQGGDPSRPFAAEHAALAGAKRAFARVALAAARRHGDRVKDEQEVLLALGDAAIQIFALESAVLRAERTAPARAEARRAIAAAAVRTFAFAATERIATAARKAAFCAAEGDALAQLLDAVARLATYDATGLLDAERRLAAATLEEERYPFA